MAKQEAINLKAKGLFSQYSRIDAPEGALLRADNIVINKVSVIEPRRGVSRYNAVAFTAVPTDMFEYKGKLVVLDGTTLKYDNGSGTFNSWTGSFTKATDAVRINTADAQNNIYFTTNTGIYKNDSITGVAQKAGVTEGLDSQYTLFNVATGWLPTNYQIAYKFVWIKKDANKNEIVGAPSPRLHVINVGAAADIRVTTTIPSDVVTDDYMEVYRTSLPSSTGIDPGDDCYLLRRIQVYKTAQVTTLARTLGTVTATCVAHGYLTGDYVQIAGAAQTEYNGIWRITVATADTFTYTIATTPVTPATGTITSTAKTVTFEDIYNDSFIDSNIALYTNTNEEGLENGNYKPPLSATITEWNGSVWFANTQREQRKALKFISTSNIVLDSSTITITGSAVHTYTFSATEDINNKKFQLVTGGLASDNLNSTMDSLVRVINRDLTNTEIYTWRDTSAEAAPGSIYIFSRTTDNTTLYFTSSVTANWDDQLPTSGTTIYSDNEDKKNRLYWSKYLKGEAVTLLNFFELGSEEHAIEAIVGLKDSLIVLKTDGIWRISGESYFTFEELDLTTYISAPASACRLGDRIMAITNKGVVKINEYGVEIVSFPIDDDLRKISTYTNFRALTRAVAHEGLNDNKYLLFTQTLSTDTITKQIWVYDYLLNIWTKYIKCVSTGHELTTNRKLYLSHGLDKYILEERRSFTQNSEDYQDEEISVSVTAVDNTGSTTKVTVTYTYTTETLRAGFLFRYSVGSIESKVTAVTTLSATSFQLTLADSITLPAATFTASVFIPITAVVTWSSQTAENVAVAKRFQQINIFLSADNALYNYIKTSTNREATEESVYCPVSSSGSSGWGSSPWGSSVWGSPSVSVATPINIDIPQQHRLAEELYVTYSHDVAKERFEILALAIFYSNLSTRFTRA